MTRFSSLLPLALLASGSLLLASCGGGSSDDSSFGSDDSADIIVEETPATITTALDKLEKSVKAVEGSSTLSPANARKEITTLRKLINNANLSTTKKQELYDKVNALDGRIVETLEKRTSDAAKAKADAEAAKAKAEADAEAAKAKAEADAAKAQQQLQQAQSLDATVVYNAYSVDNGTPGDWRYNNPTITLGTSGELSGIPGNTLILDNFSRSATNSWRQFTREQKNPDATEVNDTLTQKALARYYGTTKGYKIFADVNFSNHGVIDTTFNQGHVKGVSQFSDEELTNSGDTFRRSGTYKGVRGNYICTANANNDTCTYSKDTATGYITLGGSATWTFDPGNDNTRITIDPEYLSYGRWMTRDKDGNYRVGAFYQIGGMDGGTPSITIGHQVGTATYVGEAHGIYAIKGGALTTNTGAGEFKARATLTANFGASDTIHGKINSFDVPNSSDWEVRLKQTTIASDGKFTEEDNNSSGATWFIGTSNASNNADKYKGELLISGVKGEKDYPLLGVGAFSQVLVHKEKWWVPLV